MIITAAPPQMYAWLTSRAQTVAGPEMKAIIAFDPQTGKVGGMAGFDGWTNNSVVMSVALDSPIALRRIVHAAFEYAFLQAKKGVALATVKGSNTRSLALCRKVGFREVYRVRDGIEVGEDLVIFEMRREECRWIPEQMRKVA